VSLKDLSFLDGRVEQMGDKLLICGFIQFQYGKLSSQCKPHMPVFTALAKHGIDVDYVEQNQKFKNTLTPEKRKEILVRDGVDFCIYYNRKLLEGETPVVDHIIPKALNGKAIPSNLVVCSSTANSKKSDKPLKKFCEEEGLNFLEVIQRLSKATGNPIEDYLGSLQEQDKEKDKDKDKEQDKEIAKPSKNLSRATREEIDQFCRDNGLTPRDAEALWSKWEGNGWMNGKQKIKNWQMTIRSWKAQGYMPSQKNPQPGDLWPLDEPEGEQVYEPTPWERIQAKIKAAENAQPAPSEEPTDIEPLAEGELF